MVTVYVSVSMYSITDKNGKESNLRLKTSNENTAPNVKPTPIE